MTTDEDLAAKGRELIERFGKATEAYQRVGELVRTSQYANQPAGGLSRVLTSER